MGTLTIAKSDEVMGDADMEDADMSAKLFEEVKSGNMDDGALKQGSNKIGSAGHGMLFSLARHLFESVLREV